MIGRILAGFALAAVTSLSPGLAGAQEAGHVTGIGGVFVASKDPKALLAWYHDVLGLKIEPWGGSLLRYDAPGHPPVAVWTALKPTSSQLAPSTREFMLNFAVDDMDAILKRVEAKGVPVLEREEDATGKFAWLLDPDGTKIELWQPKGG